MKRILLALAIAHASAMSFYTQKESLFIDKDTPLIPLRVYFENKPKVFGLVTDKSKSISLDGYLCYSKTFKDFQT